MERFKHYESFWGVLLSLNLFIGTCTSHMMEVLVNSENLHVIDPPYVMIYKLDYSLKISDDTFEGFEEPNTGRKVLGIEPNQLDFLKEVFVIKGNLTITANHPNLISLSCFENLETVNNLVITNTSLLYLDLRRLKRIEHGVVIENNKNLCVNKSKEFWQGIVVPNTNGVFRVAHNKPDDQCEACDNECDQELGCWSPKPDRCRKCRHSMVRSNATCVSSCDSTTQLEFDKECWLCDPECSGGCKSLEASGCNSCKHVKREDDCIPECSHGEYNMDGMCVECHHNCHPFGCTGPLDYEVNGGCNPCEKIVFEYFEALDYYNTSRSLPVVSKCLTFNDPCPDYFYEAQVPRNALGSFAKHRLKLVCARCHMHCLKCTGYGFNEGVCQECIEEYKGCKCPPGTYYTEDADGDCTICEYGCRECKESRYCDGCLDNYYRVYTMLVPSDNATYSCLKKCPANQPFIFSSDRYQNYCLSQNYTLHVDNNQNNGMKYIYIALPVVACLVLLVIYVRMVNRANTYKIQSKIEQFFDEPDENLLKTNRAFNGTRLQTIDEFNLKKTEEIDNCAFSKVYKGILRLGGGKIQLPVAIKVFNPRYISTLNTELIKKADFMSCVNHPHLLRLLGISSTSNISLVTQFFPLGDMLHYLQTNRTDIKQNTLISWTKQIALGMDYLEEHGLVHGGLAARKVLIHTHNRVKVSCFGKETFTNIDQSAFVTVVGKYSFQWLALETLKHGVFTHKSDVWSFGVVLWEILTFGQQPYGKTAFPKLLRSLEVGQRLQQPDSCSADMYSVLATCWAEVETARPSFQELVDTFSMMARDPTHFIFVAPKDNDLTSPTLLPRDHYWEINGEEQLDVSIRNHRYVNVSNETTSLDHGDPPKSFIKPKYVNTDVNPDHMSSNIQ